MQEFHKRVSSVLRYEDGKLYWIKSGKEAGSIRKDGRVSIRLDGKAYLRYRLCWLLLKGYLPERIDHIDNNRSNDHIENLRECTQSQNRMNQGATSSKTGYKGVSWVKGTYCARIKLKGITRILGYSKDPIKCAKLYDTEAIKLFGEFANVNFK